MKKCLSSYFDALLRALRGDRNGSTTSKAIVAILVACLAISVLSFTTVKVWAACSDYFAAEEIVLPFVCSELSDYPGGATAYLFGYGFAPNEQVDLMVVRADGSPGEGTSYDPWTVTTDAGGNFATTWIVCNDCVDTVNEQKE